MKRGFKRTVSWNKYKSEIRTQTKKIVSIICTSFNILFNLSFKNGNNDPASDSSGKYYMSIVKIKDFNALIDNKPFFDQQVKNKQEAYENRIGMSRNNDYTTGNSLNFSHHQNYYKLIGTDLSRETNTNIPQAINFTEKN